MSEIFSKVIISSERAQREWNWLRSNYSPPRIEAAFLNLGGSKAFPLNLARRMRVQLPPEDKLPELPKAPMTDDQVADIRAKFRQLREEFKKRSE